jgi:hypothetical protein
MVNLRGGSVRREENSLPQDRALRTGFVFPIIPSPQAVQAAAVARSGKAILYPTVKYEVILFHPKAATRLEWELWPGKDLTERLDFSGLSRL